MKYYIIWNFKEDRPTVGVNNYGNLMVFLTKEQAQAYMLSGEDSYSKHKIKEIECKLL